MKNLFGLLLVIAAMACFVGCSVEATNPLSPAQTTSEISTDKDASYYGLDDSGDDVDWGQSGPVWFLAPAYYGQWERTANIPNGKMIFIDLAGFFTSLQMGDGADEAELRDVSAFLMDELVSNIILEVDGQRLQNIEDFRVATPPGLFGYTLPEDNMFTFFGYDIGAGTYENDAVADGYYAMLPPLSVGRHTIFLSADFGEPYNDTVQVMYHLTVTNRKTDRQRHN